RFPTAYLTPAQQPAHVRSAGHVRRDLVVRQGIRGLPGRLKRPGSGRWHQARGTWPMRIRGLPHPITPAERRKPPAAGRGVLTSWQAKDSTPIDGQETPLAEKQKYRNRPIRSVLSTRRWPPATPAGAASPVTWRVACAKPEIKEYRNRPPAPELLPSAVTYVK